MNQGQSHILIVDDESAVRMSLGDILQRRGYLVEVAASGEEAIARLAQQPFDLLVLDLKLPGLSGMEIAQHARQIQPDAEVIVLTAYASLESALEGIHLGVFDYLLKTASTQEVAARVDDAVARRQEEHHRHQLYTSLQTIVDELQGGQEEARTGDHPWIAAGTLQLSTWQQRVRVEDRVISLTPTEFRMLRCLAGQLGTVLTFQQLAREAQDRDVGEMEAAELIKPHIYHLRQKIEPDPSNPRYILTVRGVGYVLVTPSGEQVADDEATYASAGIA